MCGIPYAQDDESRRIGRNPYTARCSLCQYCEQHLDRPPSSCNIWCMASIAPREAVGKERGDEAGNHAKDGEDNCRGDKATLHKRHAHCLSMPAVVRPAQQLVYVHAWVTAVPATCSAEGNNLSRPISSLCDRPYDMQPSLPGRWTVGKGAIAEKC